MIDIAKLKMQLRLHEDDRAVVYDDATGKPIGPGSVVVGNPSIGVGRNLSSKGLTPEERSRLLEGDIYECLEQAGKFPWFAGVDSVRQMVVVELIFNMGLARFKTFRRFIDACARRDWPAAAAELADSKWQKQVDPVLGDGKGRADTLIRQISTGEWAVSGQSAEA